MNRWTFCALASFFLGFLPHSSFALIKIACVGTSITAGSTLSRYPDTFTRLLSTANCEVGNFGSTGKYVLRNAVVPPRDNVNGPYWYTDPFYQVFGYKPNAIIMEFGTGVFHGYPRVISPESLRELNRDCFAEMGRDLALIWPRATRTNINSAGSIPCHSKEMEPCF
jgi:hypothetical protein